MTNGARRAGGIARTLQGSMDVADAERAQVLPWTATVKQRYIRVVPNGITARRFAFGGEPDDFKDFG
jgi:hypothetical protein